ncbi:major facilitator superfamily domain-containing protein [Phycomyces nitens]|nr:major facilitator superfamily domain-containing protein [Phycomyces nitens]
MSPMNSSTTIDISTNEKVAPSGSKHYFLSRFLISPPVENDPRSLSSRKKSTILFCLAILVSTGGFSSTIYFPALPQIEIDFKSTPIMATLTAAMFILFMGISPIFWAAFSDHYHIRRFPNILSMVIFTASSLGAVFVTNIGGLIALRCIQSIGSSCVQAVGAGVIADIYPLEQRGAAFGKFFLALFIGPLLGPIIGGFLTMSDASWKATFWFTFAYGVFIVIFCFIFMDETYRDNEKFDLELPMQTPRENDTLSTTGTVLSENQPPKSAEIVESVPAKPKTINPIAPLFLLRHPFVFLPSFSGAVAFGGMFAVETMIPIVYTENYGFPAWKTGLSYLGAGVGNVLGTVMSSYISDRAVLRAREKRGGREVVEDRLTPNLWISGFFFMPFGLLLFGWMAERKFSVWACIIGFGCQSFGMNQIMSATAAYLVDAVPGQGASASAAANMMRMCMACVLTLVVSPLMDSIGTGWTTVFLAGLSWFAMVILVIVVIFGERLRKWSGF